MADLDPLVDAYIGTDDNSEAMFIKSLINDLNRGDDFPRRLYTHEDGPSCCSPTTFKALGEVLKNIDKAKKKNKDEGEGESHGQKKLDFDVVSVDLESQSGEVSAAPTPKPRSKASRPPPKIRPRRKAALVALRRMRGLPDSNFVVLSSDEEAEH